ncbi:MAG TPA: hypothetical protein VGF58_05280 [Burkholderiales bacterium]|jgi:hypothetical protein
MVLTPFPGRYFFSSFFSSIGAAGVAGAADEPEVDGLADGELGAADDDGDEGAGAEEEGAEAGALELGAFLEADCSPHAARASAAAAAISRVLVIAGP